MWNIHTRIICIADSYKIQLKEGKCNSGTVLLYYANKLLYNSVYLNIQDTNSLKNTHTLTSYMTTELENIVCKC